MLEKLEIVTTWDCRKDMFVTNTSPSGKAAHYELYYTRNLNLVKISYGRRLLY